jgi:hypothetical protein
MRRGITIDWIMIIVEMKKVVDNYYYYYPIIPVLLTTHPLLNKPWAPKKHFVQSLIIWEREVIRI